MQPRPRYSLMRRILFPYNGEEPLTRRQGARVIGAWALFFACIMAVCSSPFILAAAGTLPLNRLALLFLFAFLTGVIVFGCLAWIAVSMNNRAARIMQRRKAREQRS